MPGTVTSRRLSRRPVPAIGVRPNGWPTNSGKPNHSSSDGRKKPSVPWAKERDHGLEPTPMEARRLSKAIPAGDRRFSSRPGSPTRGKKSTSCYIAIEGAAVAGPSRLGGCRNG